MSSQTSPRATSRSGIALPIALAAVIIVGALITGVFFASTQEYRVGRNSLAAQRAAHAAEVGLSNMLSTWTSARTDSVKIGFACRMTDTLIDGVTVKRQFTRVSQTTFWLTATAIQGGGALEARATKRLNAIMRIQTPDFKIMGAITARGKTAVEGASKISGTDTVPDGWNCPPGGPTGSGVVVNDSATNYTSTSANVVLNGNPKVKDSTAMVRDTMTFTDFGGFDYDSLAALATKVRSGGGKFATIGPKYKLDGSCDIDHADNWGEQSLTDGNAACASYMPVVHLKDVNVTYTLDGGPGGSGGQGILLVDGHLNLAGLFSWTGIIIVRGRVRVTGSPSSGPRIVGALAAMNRNSPDSTNLIAGGSITAFSRCVVNQVSSRVSSAGQLKDRSWADLSY